MRLAAGLRPDPLWELQRSPRSPSRNRERGGTSKGKRGKGREREGEGEGDGRGGWIDGDRTEERDKDGRERGGIASS